MKCISAPAMAKSRNSATRPTYRASLLRLANTPATMIAMPVPNHMICMKMSMVTPPADPVLDRTRSRPDLGVAKVPICESRQAILAGPVRSLQVCREAWSAS